MTTPRTTLAVQARGGAGKRKRNLNRPKRDLLVEALRSHSLAEGLGIIRAGIQYGFLIGIIGFGFWLRLEAGAGAVLEATGTPPAPLAIQTPAPTLAPTPAPTSAPTPAPISITVIVSSCAPPSQLP